MPDKKRTSILVIVLLFIIMAAVGIGLILSPGSVGVIGSPDGPVKFFVSLEDQDTSIENDNDIQTDNKSAVQEQSLEQTKGDEVFEPGFNSSETISKRNLGEMLKQNEIDLSDDLISAFYRYYLMNIFELSMLPDFGPSKPADWDQLTMYIYINYAQPRYDPEHYNFNSMLTKEDFAKTIKKYFGTMDYYDHTSSRLTYTDGVYTVEPTDATGVGYYRLADISKEPDGIYTAVFDGLFIGESDYTDQYEEATPNMKAILDAAGTKDYSQIADFDKIVLDIFLKENYREVLNMTERVTVRFTLSADENFQFVYKSCKIEEYPAVVEPDLPINDEKFPGKNLITYTDGTFDFSLDFPEKWEYSINPNIEATKEIEATPDSGIEIFVNEEIENRIYVFQQRGHISIPDLDDYEVETIITSSGLKGDLYKREADNIVEIRCIIDEFIGVIVFMNDEIYDKNIEEIMDIIYSIRHN